MEEQQVYIMENRINQIIEKMEITLPDFETGDGASDEIINEIEEKFSIVFPADYRYFLKKYGYVDWDGTCILGYCNDKEMAPYYSAPYFTESDRKQPLPEHFRKRPENTWIVGPYGGGGHFFMYCENSASPGRTVLLLNELSGCADKRLIWSTFSDFLEHYVNGKRRLK